VVAIHECKLILCHFCAINYLILSQVLCPPLHQILAEPLIWRFIVKVRVWVMVTFNKNFSDLWPFWQMTCSLYMFSFWAILQLQPHKMFRNDFKRCFISQGSLPMHQTTVCMEIKISAVSGCIVQDQNVSWQEPNEVCEIKKHICCIIGWKGIWNMKCIT